MNITHTNTRLWSLILRVRDLYMSEGGGGICHLFVCCAFGAYGLDMRGLQFVSCAKKPSGKVSKVYSRSRCS